jgi:Domain of unknown function (DUF1708)
MHPHWHSTSPEVQHRLISHYLLSLTSTNPDGATSPTSPTAVTTFESELHYAHSPHDVAAVLRWALRHLKLEGDGFGKESGDWTWFNRFAEAERAGSYPPDAFSNSLIPQLPTAHTELLITTLDIISSLSARSEANGSSGSKLSKFFGLWLLTSDDSTECDDWRAFYDRWDRSGRILEHLFLARIRFVSNVFGFHNTSDGNTYSNDAHRLPRRLTELVEHYPYDYGVDTPKDDLLPRPRFSTRQYDALFVQVDTEYTGSVKPKSHPLRLIADALRAQPTSEPAIAEDDRLWDAIKKASFTSDASEGASDTVPAEPIPIFSNVFSDETIRLFSLIPVDVPDKDKSAPTFALRSPISPKSRSFSLPETPILVQADRGSSPSSGHALVAPGLSANNSTAPPTASPETPTDWLQFSSQGFGTIPGTRDLITTLWDNDVEKTAPPVAPLSRKSSRRAYSRHSSLDSPRTPVQPLPTAAAPPISKAMLITRVKLDEAFIDFWADALLDPSSRRWPHFVLCQLKSLSPIAASATPTPAWLVIEQRFVHPAPVSPGKEAVEATVSPARPRASSPHPPSRPESSRLSAAFSIVSKKRFPLFTGGSGDPKEKENRLPQVGELGEGLNGTGESTATQKPEETEAKAGVEKDAVPVVMTAVAAAIGVSATAVAAAGEDITQTPREDDLPAGTTVVAPSELVGASAPKADEPVKDEPQHGTPSQNGLANDEQHDEAQRELEPETAAARGPAGDDAILIPLMPSEPVESETEPAVSRVEAETTQPQPVSVAGIGEGTIVQTEVTPLEHEPLRPEPAAVPELSAPELSSTPAVEEALPAEENDTVPTIPLADAPVSEESMSASAAAEPIPVTVESAVVQAPVPLTMAAMEEPLKEAAAPQVAQPEPELELEPAVEAKPAAQDPPADEGSPNTEVTRALEEASVPVAERVLVSETLNGASPEGMAEDSPSELASPPAPEEDISTLPVPDQADSAATQTVPEALVPSAEPEAEDEAFVTQPAEEDLRSQATPKESFPTADPATSAEDETAEGMTFRCTCPGLFCVLTPWPDASVAEPVLDEASASNKDIAPDVLEGPVTEPVPGTAIGHDMHSYTNGSAELVVAHAEQVDAGEPDTAVITTGNASVTSPVDETAELKEEAGIVAESQATSNESESAIPADELSAPVPEISASITEQPVPSNTEADLFVEALAPATQETGATTEEAASVGDGDAGPPSPNLVPAGVLEVTAPEAAGTSAEAETPVDSDVVPEEAAPATTDAFAVDSVPATEEPTPPIEDAVPTHDDALAEQSISVPEESEEPTLLEESASAATEVPADSVPVPVPEEPVPVTDAAAPITEAPAGSAPVEDPAPLTDAVTPVTEVPADPVPVLEEPVPVTDAAAPVTEAPADPVVEDPAPLTDAATPVTEVPADPVPVLKEPVPATDAAASTTETSADPAPVPEEPVPATDAAAPTTTEAPAGPASVLEESTPETEAVAPVTEIPPHEQSTPDLGETPAPEPTVPEPPAENPASMPEDPAPATESAAPTTDETSAETAEDGALGSPSPEPAAAEPVSTAEDHASGSKGSTFEPEPVVEDTELVVEEPELVVEEPELVVEEPELVVEEPELVVEDPELDVEEPELVVEEPELVVEEPELVVEEPELVVEEPELVVEDPELDVEEPEVIVEEPEFVIEEPELVIKDPELVVEDSEPVVEEPVPADEQAQEPAALSSSEAPVVSTQEPRGAETAAAYEQEAPLEISTLSEANGAAKAGKIRSPF